MRGDFSVFADEPTYDWNGNFTPQIETPWAAEAQRYLDLNPQAATPPEGFAVPPPAAAAPQAAASEFAVAPPAASPTAPQAPAANPPSLTQPGQPVDPFAALDPGVLAAPEFGQYARSAGDYVPPQLMPADPSKGFSTPYYAAHTSDNDPAGNVMVAPGQKVRIVDSKTGQTVYEGTGPEAAQHAVGIANAVSDDRGRKAAWQIHADVGDGWQLYAEDRPDPKKTGVLGTVMDIAAPIILSALLPGLGTALAGALGTFGGTAAFHGLANLGSGLLQGESLKTAGIGALGSGLTAGTVGNVLNRIPGANELVQNVTRPVQNAFNTVLGPVTTVLDPVNQGLVNIIDGAGNVIHSVSGGIDAAQNFVKDSLGGVLTGGGTVAPITVTAPSVPLPGFSVPIPSGTVEGVTVTPRPQQDPIPTPVDFVSDELTVEGRPPERPGPPVDPLDLDGLTTDVEPITVSPSTPPTPAVPVTSIPTPEVLPPALDPNPGPLTPPIEVPAPVLNPFPGIPSDPPPLPGGYGINSNAGTRGSLGDIFRASLPPPTFGSRTPRNVQVDQRYAIERPEARFFERAGVTPGPEQFSVMNPTQARLAGIGDINGDGAVDDLDLAVWRKRFSGRGYRTGGHVRGPGTGRSDSIEARLSNNEYVIDAETVALLGDGSSDAGAKALDDMRVNVRRHKGRKLARGKFSDKAHAPAVYMGGR